MVARKGRDAQHNYCTWQAQSLEKQEKYSRDPVGLAMLVYRLIIEEERMKTRVGSADNVQGPNVVLVAVNGLGRKVEGKP